METSGNISQNPDELLVHYLTGSASPEEREAAIRWIRTSTENQKYFNELQKIYHLTKIIHRPSGFDKETGWDRIKANYYQQRFTFYVKENRYKLRKLCRRIAASAAAVIIVVALAGLLLFSQKSGTSILAGGGLYNEIVAPIGSRSHVTLSDGTDIWLNAGSKLQYPARFGDGEREVYLEGEAFFDVVEGKKLFIVRTSDLNIKVYGTQFNVKSYPDEDLIETTLVEGKLSVESIRDQNIKEPIMLEPNQKVTYIKSTQVKPVMQDDGKSTIQENVVVEEKPAEIVIIPRVDPVLITSWKDSEWVFSREPLGELAVKLERRFNVEITFEDESLKNYRFTGNFKDETFEQVLGILQIGAPVLYTIDKNKVILKEDLSFKLRYDRMISNPN
ncbi:MAG: DUF4974 domain-containing protein [Bacteroidales bacterium]|nr:DUF4974 domain-containing protein [Bacteroidales bacterium]